MTTPRTCAECSSELPSDAPQGLCPKCLLKHGMDLRLLSLETLPSIVANPVIRYFGDYEIEREIARGGMGAVFKAWQLKLNRPVAVKMILEGRLANEEAVKRFHTEAEAAANLQHPNIVSIHEIGNHDGQHYFSMDYVEGQNLSELANNKPMAPAKAAGYVKTIAEAIHYAHQRGTLHRDLKPSNVLIDQHGNPRITDFGLAKLVKSDRNVTVTGAVLGTPSYMAPEQATGRQDQVGPQTDVYSLGAILYELLTSRPPFLGHPMATIRAVIESEPIAPRRVNRDVPIDLEVICLKCLEKSPQRRYSSARELAEELDRYLKSEPILARPASPVRKAAGWLRRHPGQLAAVAALVILAMAVFLFYMVEQNAFLRARLNPQGLIHEPGTFAAALKQWKVVSHSATMLGFLISLWYVLRSRRAHWRALLSRDIWYRPAHSVGSSLRGIICLVGLIDLACAAVLIGCIIRAYVWENLPPHFGDGLHAYAVSWLGVYLPWLAWQDYRRYVIGGLRHELPADQAAAIQRAVSESDIGGAMQMYHQALPDADTIDAREHVLRLMQSLGVKPSLLFGSLNIPRMAACVGILALIVGILGYVLAPAQLFPFVGRFGAAFYLGLTLAALPWISGLSWRILALLPAILIQYIAYATSGSISISAFVAPWFVGLIGGIVVMGVGLSPARRGTRTV